MYRRPPTWHLYPADVPLTDRGRCGAVGCDDFGEVVEVRANLRGEIAPPVEPATSIFCLTHARAAGYVGPSHVLPPEHLSAFHRLLTRVANHPVMVPEQG